MSNKNEFDINKLGTVKCNKCGYENIKGVRRCGKCDNLLIKLNCICPKCGKKYASTVIKCDSCGYNKKYDKVKRLFNTLLILIVLGGMGVNIFMYGDYKYNFIVNIVLGIILLLLLLPSVKSSNMAIDYDVDKEDPAIKKAKLRKNKKK